MPMMRFIKIYRAHSQIVGRGLSKNKMKYFDCARQSTIDPTEEHHSRIGKGDEEDQLGKVAASQNALDYFLTVPKQEVEQISFSPDPIDPEMTLENFLPQENLIAHQLLSEHPPFNPIFLYGPSGVGKTHLLMAAAI